MRPTATECMNNTFLKGAEQSKAPKTKKLEVCKKMLGLKQQSLFQRQISAFISNTIMATSEMREIKRVFREIDGDDNGTIDLEELRAGLPKLGEFVSEITEDTVDEIFNNMDMNKDGMISESEFLSSCCTISEEHLRKAFVALDSGKNNYIDKVELQAAFSQQGSCTNVMQDEIWTFFVGDVD